MQHFYNCLAVWTQRYSIQGRTWCPSHQPCGPVAAAEVPAEGHALLCGAIKFCPLGPTKEQFSWPDRFQNAMFYWLRHCQIYITVRFLPLSTTGFLSVLLMRPLSPSHLKTALREMKGCVCRGNGVRMLVFLASLLFPNLKTMFCVI